MTSDSLITLAERYGIPLEAVIKSDLLRLGVSFSREALEVCRQAKPKSYFIFSFDRVSSGELSRLERTVVPEEVELIGGPFDLKQTIVSVRVNPKSPYSINAGVGGSGGRVSLFSEPAVQPPQSPAAARLGPRPAEDFGLVGAAGLRELPQKREPRPPSNEFGLQLTYLYKNLCEIRLPHRPPYYDVTLKSGKPVADIAPTIEWGYLIYLTTFRLCQYWGSEEECQFCDINNNYRQQKAGGRTYTGVKDPQEIVEALQIIHNNDPEKMSQAYTVSGGAITRDLNGMTEAEFYARYARAIEERFPGRWIGKANVQALPLEQVKILREAGYQIYHPNFEVWDKQLFAKLCPGKERFVGRNEWNRRILDAAEIFGPTHVIPNFVAGIEMSRPYGFKTVDQAMDSTAEGLEFFMSRGILPRFTVWCVEPGTALTEQNSEPPPLEYFVQLLAIYRETFRKYKLQIPPGYGEPGVGRAVFSVSAFMDVI